MNLNPFRREKRAALDTSSPLYQAWLANWGATSSSGATVNANTALTSVAVLACLQVRAETFASLPGGVYRKDGDSRVAQSDHPVQRLLFDRPNDAMTSGEMWRWKSIKQDSEGNAYIRVEWRRGWPVAAWPLTGAKPKQIASGRSIVYRYDGDTFTPKGDYPASEILHFKGPMLADPYEAKSLVTLTAENIGLAIDTERFFGRFLGNGNHFPVYLETDEKLEPKDIKALREQMQSSAGVLSAGETRIFDRGLHVKSNGMSLKDADLSLHQRWILEQVCRTWRVPLPLVQDWTHGTYTNNEQGGLWFAQHTITPMCIDTERVCRKLFLDGEADTYVKFTVDGLLRGDFATRMAGYSTAIAGGFMVRQEARAKEDWDPLPGLEKPLVPLNMGIIGKDGGVEATTNPSVPGASSVTPPNPARSLEPILADAVECIRTRAEQDRARGRDSADTVSFAQRKIAPIATAYDIAGLDFDTDGVISLAVSAR